MASYNDMNTGFEFMNNPIMPGMPERNQPFFQQSPTPPQTPSYNMDMSLNSAPQIATPSNKKSMFTVVPDDEEPMGANTLTLPTPDVGLSTPSKRGRKKKR